MEPPLVPGHRTGRPSSRDDPERVDLCAGRVGGRRAARVTAAAATAVDAVLRLPFHIDALIPAPRVQDFEDIAQAQLHAVGDHGGVGAFILLPEDRDELAVRLVVERLCAASVPQDFEEFRFKGALAPRIAKGKHPEVGEVSQREAAAAIPQKGRWSASQAPTGGRTRVPAQSLYGMLAAVP